MYTSFDNIGLVKVLEFLKSHKSEYLSGEDLSDVLKISRVAVWKHIKKIRRLGYTVESKQKRGYRFVKTTDQLLPWEILPGLTSKYLGKRIYYFEEIDSTQNFALQMAQNKKENGAIIIAKKQTDGKGRLKRKWISPKGGIWFSIILHPKFTIEESMLLPIVASVALSSAIEKSLKIKTSVKWPNDITVGGKKVAGMLIDSSFQSNSIENIILGIGINFKINTKELEKKISRKPNFYGVGTLLKQLQDGNPTQLMNDFIHELEKNIGKLENGKKSEIIKDWTKNSETVNKKVTVNTANGKISGIAQKINSDGTLQIKTKYGSQRIFVGDVTVN